MGMQGGVSLIPVKELRQHWGSLKTRLIDAFYQYRDEEDYLAYIESANKLPDNIGAIPDEDICDLFKEFSYQDCPVLFNGVICTAWGDGVPYYMKALDDAFNGFSIDTWT